ncbi:MAG TPA: triple tyrosine motif-containing protein [Cytophagales bacterium]|nr:triple tyrosine motif-containing protein [Cytophagales bacterium]
MHLEFKKLIVLLSFALILPLAAFAQEVNSIGVPYVENYSKSTYQSGNQNWSITKDQNEIMYFGNSERLLVFDGEYWNKYYLPNRLIIRSVVADSKGRVYTGAFGEFGYWAYNKKGKFVYHSLSKLIPGKTLPKDEIWKIYIDGDRVIFQSFVSIFIYENEKLTELKADSPFLFLFKVGNRFLVQVISKGLFELKGKRLEYISGSDAVAQMEILSILPFKNSKYLIGTSKNGLFLYDGESIEKWNNQANEFLSTYQLNNGVVLWDKYFAFGTILNGIIIIDDNGRVIQKINKSSGLQNNTILSLCIDNQQNLWAGLDNGIDRIELNSPLYFYFDKTGSFGTVYSSIVFDNKIYLGTNQGLFYSEWHSTKNATFRNFDFKLIPGSQGQVWDLALIDGQLICGHNNGTYLVKGSSIEKISDIGGGWTIKKFDGKPELLIQGTYIGLVLYKKDINGQWTFFRKIDEFVEPSRYVEQDNKGQVWVSHAYKGIFKLTLSEDLTTVISSKNYDEKSGLPTTYNVNIFNLEDRLVFSSDSGFYVFDAISDKFFRYEQLNQMLGSFSRSNKIIKASEKKYWFINHGNVALIDFTQPGKPAIDSARFNMLEGKMVQYYENISQISNSLYLISVDDGFAIYNDLKAQSIQKESIPQVLIRRVEYAIDNSTKVAENGQLLEMIEIPFLKNNIRISYALPYYRQGEIKYQFFLEGYSNQWSEWSSLTEKEFSNLNHGTYQFRIRAKVKDGKTSETGILNFRVLSPWYLSNWAIVFYIVFSIGFAIFLRYLYLMNLKKHRVEIQQKLQKEKEEYLKQEAIANEQKIVKLKNEQLRKDLSGKSRELANSAMNIVYKNELLEKIRQGIYELKDSQGKRLSEDQLKKIQKIIDEGMNDERDWNLFERSFNEAHENFFKKLKANHPKLVPNDLKLCAYLRMNMSSKEMASLLNITLRGVEIRRYRLRKKLDLDHDKNLVEFLMEL